MSGLWDPWSAIDLSKLETLQTGRDGIFQTFLGIEPNDFSNASFSREQAALATTSRGCCAAHSGPSASNREGGGVRAEVIVFEGIDRFYRCASDDAWALAEVEDRGGLPAPKTCSGRFVQRIPETLRMWLAKP